MSLESVGMVDVDEPGDRDLEQRPKVMVFDTRAEHPGPDMYKPSAVVAVHRQHAGVKAASGAHVGSGNNVSGSVQLQHRQSDDDGVNGNHFLLSEDERVIDPTGWPAAPKPPRAAPSRFRKDTDYRLRGLNLEPQQAMQAARSNAGAYELRRKRRRRLLAGWIGLLLLAATVTMAVRATIGAPFVVHSGAMEPALYSGDRIIVLSSTRLGGSIKRGNIIVFRHPEPSTCKAGAGTHDDLVERVIALPGQTIWSDGDNIFIDGKRLDDSGWFDPRFGELASIPIPRTTVPAGDYFVLGDNRFEACDSRAFGTIAASSVTGKAIGMVQRNGHLFIRRV
jgi:signal peptidase I